MYPFSGKGKCFRSRTALDMEIQKLQLMASTLSGSKDPYLRAKEEFANSRLEQLVPLCKCSRFLSVPELQKQVAALEEANDSPTLPDVKLEKLKKQLDVELTAQRKLKAPPITNKDRATNKKQKI